MDWADIALGIAAIWLIYYWSTSSFDFWSSRGVVGPKPMPLIGNLGNVLVGKTSFGEYLKDVCDEYPNAKMIGIFARKDPIMIVQDADIIKDVLIKDFSAFSDRGLRTFNRAEPLSQHLVNLESARWRPLRTKLSPAFTSGKLRKMFYLLNECGAHLEEYLEKIVPKGEAIECRELTAKYTTDVIGNCAFGLQMNALTDEDSEFRRMGREIFSMNWKKFLKFRLRDNAPSIYALLGPLLTDWKLTNFFLNIMRDTVEYRKKNNVVKHDFIDLIMELRDNPDKLGDIELTDTLLTAQLFVFFLAGFETSSTTMSHALYELAQNHQIQDRLREEIRSHLSKCNGELTYESTKAMSYLHMVFQETLRKYPPATVLSRKSVEPYIFSDPKVTIPAGTKLMIPVFAIHRDPKIYPKPEVFDPERFTEAGIASRHTMNWLPFGDGPRNCIGARFANYQSKVGLIKILQHFKVDVCEQTEIPYVIDPKSFLLAPINGIRLKFSKVT